MFWPLYNFWWRVDVFLIFVYPLLRFLSAPPLLSSWFFSLSVISTVYILYASVCVCVCVCVWVCVCVCLYGTLSFHAFLRFLRFLTCSLPWILEVINSFLHIYVFCTLLPILPFLNSSYKYTTMFYISPQYLNVLNGILCFVLYFFTLLSLYVLVWIASFDVSTSSLNFSWLYSTYGLIKDFAFVLFWFGFAPCYLILS